MSLGRHDGSGQQEFWIATHKIARSPGHPFYEALNRCLKRAGFDRFVENLCEPYYADRMSRPSIPPRTYFRMLMVGYFEGLDSQRAIAWRCSDSFSLRQFLAIALDQQTPDHSSLTGIRQRRPLELYLRVFQFVLSITRRHGLLSGKTVDIDATTVEANAAMKSIVRKDSGEGWNDYIKRLMEQDGDCGQGQDGPSDQEARRYDRKRGSKKKVSNREWKSPTDPDARIAKMKDGRTRVAYKATHAVDLESGVVVSVEVERADSRDADGLPGHLDKAEENLFEAEAEPDVREVVADKGYHKTQTLSRCASRGMRTYVAEPKARGRRRSKGRPPGWQEAVYGNRGRAGGARGKRHQRRRSELLERGFAHVCDTEGPDGRGCADWRRQTRGIWCTWRRTTFLW